MKEQLELLTRIQEIDEQIDRHESNLARLPHEVQELARGLVLIRRETTENEAKLSSLDKDLRQKERDLAGEQEKIKRSEKRLLAIKNQKEYNALSKEIKMGAKVVSELEEAILALMGELEKIKKAQEKRQTEYEELEQSLKTKKKEARLAEKEAEAALAGLKDKKIKATQKVEKYYLKKYEIVKKARGNAVAEMNNGSCTACHMAIPPQLSIRVLKQEEFIQCPNCRRIMYIKTENIPEHNKLD